MSDRPALPGSLRRNPDLDTWLRIERDGTVTVFTGKVEIGQSIRTAIARIAAEELDVRLERVRVQTADTARGPDEILTAGSMSVEQSGGAVRLAAAEARQVMLEAAAARLGAPLHALEVEDGIVRAAGSGRVLGYAELQGGRPFERRVTGEAVVKSPASYRIVGKPGPRIDLRDKLTGGAFLQDLAPPGLLFGRVVRPPSYAAELVQLDAAAVRALPGVVAVVHDGRYLGVVAEREDQAVAARDALAAAAEWREAETLPGEEAIFDWLAGEPRESYPVVEGVPQERPVSPWSEPREAARTLEASYERPFVMHASLGPSSALARLENDRLTVFSHSQSITLTRLALAQALDRPAESIRLIHADGPGCYGHNAADDAALDAALLALAVPGRPVLFQHVREDENRWEPYGPAMRVDMKASLDRGGRILAWSHDAISNTHVGRPIPGTDGSQLAPAWLRAVPLARPEPRARLAPEVGIHRNAWPAYALPDVRVVKHLVKSTALRTSSLRGLGAFANVFAIESFMDELAEACGSDPVAFRLRHLDDPRARAVLEAAAARADWRRPAASGRGQGIAYARYENSKAYAAVVAEVEVGRGGEIRLERLVIAADAGLVIDPNGLANQLEGGAVQAASWTLKEAVRFDRTRVTSVDWETYPILTFAESPRVETVLLDRPEETSLGAGEATQGPTPAAIANAVFHASGLRLRRTPFTPARVRAASGG